MFFDHTLLDSICEILKQGTHQIILSHYLAVDQLRNVGQDIWVKKIYPKTNIFGLIKNIHFKKESLEFIDYSAADFKTRVDQAFIIIDNNYQKISQDTECPDDLTIDFGLLYNIEYLVDLFESVHGFPPDKIKIDWAKTRVETDKLLNRYTEPYDQRELDEMLKLGQEDYTKLANERNETYKNWKQTELREYNIDKILENE